MAECGATILPATLLGALVHVGDGCYGLKADVMGIGSSRTCDQVFGIGDLAAIIGADGIRIESSGVGDPTQPLPCEFQEPIMTMLARVIALDANGDGALLIWDSGDAFSCGDQPECDDAPLETMLRGCMVQLPNEEVRIRTTMLGLGDPVECDQAAGIETMLRRCIRSLGDGKYSINLMTA